MEAVPFIFLGIFAGALIMWFFLVRKHGESATSADTQATMLLGQNMDNLRKELNEQLHKINEQMRHSMIDVAREQTKANEATRQMVTIAEELQSLQDILKNPKQRGVLGEYYLETLLKNVLPAGSYKMQHVFKDGEIVDAAVFVKDKVIPIDSKFSLENYNRLVEARDPSEKSRLEKIFVNDLKNRIVETAKYIRPSEGTMEFAFMFIPHEAIYYDLLVNKVGAMSEDTENLIQRAAGKYRVIIVSPTSFLAYLQTVLQGLRAMEIEENIKETIKYVNELGKHLKHYEEYHNKLGNALGTVFNHYAATSKEFKKIDKDMVRITGSSPGLEATLLEKPQTEE
jgi:DNA recombination protein RmuC